MKKFNTRVRGSSLVEVIVALIIISMVFSIAVVVYVNVQKNGFSTIALRAEMILDETYNETIKKGLYKPREKEVGEWIVYQDVSPYEDNMKLLVVRLEVRNEDGEVMLQKKHLHYEPDNNK